MKAICKAMIVIAVMICAAFVVSASSDSDAAIQASGNVGTQNSGTWELEDGRLTITLVNPGTVDGTKIPNDHRPWGSWAGSIQYVVINGYTILGKSDFSDYNSLKEVTSNSLVEICYRAFYHCDNLVKVTLPDLQKVYTEAFRECKKLKTIEFTDPAKGCDLTINADAYCCFYNCEVLERIGSGDSYKISGKLGSDNFNLCKALFSGATLDLSGITYLGNYNFCYTKVYAISEMTNCTYLGYETFRFCYNLVSVGDMPALTSTSTRVFYECPELQTVGSMTGPITAGVENILGGDSFVRCKKLTTVGDLTAFTQIGGGAFYECEKLQSIGAMTNLKNMTGDSVFRGCDSLESIGDFPSLETMCNYEFYHCDKLETVGNFPNLTALGNETFRYCGSLTTVGDFNSLKTVNANCFVQCGSLKTVGYMGMLETIESSAFYQCSQLQSINLNPHVKEIKGSAIRDCVSLTTISGGTAVTFDSLQVVGDNAFQNSAKIVATIDFSNIVTIGGSAFAGEPFITELQNMPCLLTIGGSAFYNCPNLTKIGNMPIMTTIGSSAFYKCTSLTSVGSMPSVEKIDSSAFYMCTSLTGNIGDMPCLKYLNSSAFRNTAIVSVGNMPELLELGQEVFKDNKDYLKSVGEMGKLETVGLHAFYNCQSLETLGGFPSAKTIKYSAFEGCKSLREITKMGQVQIIETSVFNNCTNLTAIGSVHSVIGGVNAYDFTYVTEIGGSAFTRCAVTGLVFSNTSLTKIAGSTFYDCDATVIKGLESLTEIPSSSFAYCSVKDLVLTSAKYVRSSAFAYCEVESVTFGTNLQFIESYGFHRCEDLTTIKGWGNIGYDYSGKAIGYEAFRYCYKLSTVDKINPTGANYVYADYCAFANCDSLTSLEFATNISEMGTYCFYHCNGVREIPKFGLLNVIPANCFDYTGYIDNNTVWLDKVTIGENILYINNGAFSSSQIKNLVFEKDDPYYLRTDGNVFTSWNVSRTVTINNSVDLGLLDKMAVRPTGLIVNADDMTRSTQIKMGTLATKTLQTLEFNSAVIDSSTIDRKITFNSSNNIAVNSSCKVMTHAFSNIATIKYMTFGPSVDLSQASYMISGTSVTSLEIPHSAFSTYMLAECSTLVQVTFDSCISIPEGTFKDCVKLETVITPTNLYKIGAYAFDGCSSLVDLGSGGAGSGMDMGPVSEIDKYAFQNALTTESNREVKSSYDGVVIIEEHAFYNSTKIVAFIMPSGADIRESAFEGCTGLSRLGPSTTPSDTLNFVNVTNIGQNAFKGCNAAVNISHLSTNVPSNCFYGCQSLKLITDSVPKSIAEGAFEDCVKLEAVLGTGMNMSSCTSIGERAFKNTKICGVANLTLMTYIGQSAFEGSKLQKVDMGSSAINVIQLNVFKNCTALTEFKSNAVTELKSGVFSGCTSLNFVNIPKAVTFADDTFAGCEAITLISTESAGTSTSGLYISDSITQLSSTLGVTKMPNVVSIKGFTKLTTITGNGLFQGSTKLQNVSISGPLTKLPDYTFDSCTRLAEVSIPGTVAIGDYAFNGCMGMTKVVFTGVYTIGSNAFYNCKYLADLGTWNNLGRENGVIGDYAFYGCTSLEALPTTENKPAIGGHAFEGCSSLSNISGVASAKSLGEACFKQIAIQTMPEFVNITSFPAEVFASCTNLNMVIVPENVGSIKASSFSGCNLIQTVYFKGDNPCFKDGSNYVSFGTASTVYIAGNVDLLDLFGMVPYTSVLYVNSGGTVRSVSVTNSGSDKKVIQNVYFFNSNIGTSSIEVGKVGFKEVEITGTNCSISAYAFKGMTDLTSILVGNDIDISTATGAFSNTSLSTVNITQTTIPSEMFSGCKSLTTATITNCKAIPSKLFMNCDLLESVYIAQAESIGASAFQGCTVIAGIGPTGSGMNLTYVKEIGDAAFVGALQSGSKIITIGTNVKTEVTIGSNAFKGASAITKITFGDKVAKITLGNNSFDGCTSLTAFNDNSIINLDGPFQLGSSVFLGCVKISKVNIGSTTLGDSTFENCEKLTSVIAQTAITSSNDLIDIGKKVFLGTALVNFGEDSAISSINLTMVRSIGDQAFYGVSPTNLIIGPFITSIGSNVFSSVSMASSDLVLPNSLASVGTNAFGESLAVRSITIPSSLRTIASGAFQLAGSAGATYDIYLDVSNRNDLQNMKNGSFVVKNTDMNISIYYGGMDDSTYVKALFDKPAGVSFNRVKYAELTYDSNKDGGSLIYTRIVAVEGSYTILPYLVDTKAGSYTTSTFGFIDGERPTSSTKSIIAGKSGDSIRIWPPTDSWSKYVCDESYVNITHLESTVLEFKDSDGLSKGTVEYSYGQEVLAPAVTSAGAYYRGTISDAELDAGEFSYIGYYEEEAILNELEKKLKISYYLESSCSGEPYAVVELDRDDQGYYRVKLPEETPTKDGYTLISWETSKGIIAEVDDEGKMVVDQEFIVKSNMDAWANWEAIEYTILIYDTSTQPSTVAATIVVTGQYDLVLSDDGKGVLILTDDVNINKEVFTASKVRDGWEYYMYSVSNMFGQTETVEVGDGNAFIKAEGRYANLTMDLLMTERSYAITYSCTGLEGTDEPTKPANPETVKYEKIESIQVKAWTCHGYSLKSVTVNGKNTTVQGGYVTLSKEYVKGKTSIDIKFNFEKGTYNVAFDYQNGSPVTYNTNVVKVGTSKVLLSRPSLEEKSGYTFDHWYWGTDDAEHSYTPTDTDMVTFTQSMADTANDENLVTFKAKWVPNQYTIKYSMNGSPETPTTDEQYTKFYTDETKILWTPTEGGYIGHSFKGWSLDGTTICNNPDYTMKMSPEKFISYVQNGTITMIALWSDLQFYIAFDIDGAKGGAAPNRIGPFKLNDTFSVPSHGNLYKDYCTYGGWKIPGTQYAWNDGAVDTMKSEYARYATVNLSGEYVLTLKMIWTKASYYVTYRENGGYFQTAIPTVGPLEVDTENPQEFVPPNINDPDDPYYMAVKRDGFSWVGWNYDKNSTMALVFDGTFNAQLASEADSNNIVALYAVWTGVIYKITYELNGGLPGAEMPPLGSYNDEVTVSNPTKVGYEFTGWKITGVTAGAQYKIGKSYFEIKEGDIVDATVFKNLSNSIDTPVKMEAQWTLVSYTLQYDLSGGSGTVTIPEGKDKVKIGDSLKLATTDATRQGYSFSGWSFDKKTIVSDGATFTTVMAEYADALYVVILYAVWQPLTYTVAYSFDEGSTSSQTVTAYYDETLNLDKPTKDNKIFIGWKAKSGLNVNTAYYSRDGVIWYAWSDLETLVEATYFMNLTDNGGRVELVAQWTDDKFFITFNGNGGEGDVPADMGPYRLGDAVSLPTPTSLVKEGYDFVGWSINRVSILTTNVFNSMMVSAADENNMLTLYAMWSAGSYTVQVRDSEDSEYRSTTAYFDASVAIETPELDGYKFLGWSSNEINVRTAQYSHDGVSWYTWNSTSTAVDGTFFMNLTSNNGDTVHMTATWEALNYTVVYNANGGTGTPPVDDTVYHIGDSFTLASTDSLKGTNGSKEIIGWDFTRNPNEQYPLSGGVFDTNMTDHADKTNVVTLYAVWTDGKVKVTVNLAGGTASNTPLGWTKNSDGTYSRLIETGTYTKEALESWDKVTIIKDGYSFKGWSYESEKVSMEMTVTAVYSEVNPSFIYILIAVIVVAVIGLFIYTRIERR